MWVAILQADSGKSMQRRDLSLHFASILPHAMLLLHEGHIDCNLVPGHATSHLSVDAQPCE